MSDRRRRAAFALAALCHAHLALAQSPAARELAQRGFAAREAQRDDEALRLFREALALDGSPMVLAQVALAELALGRWRDADTHLREARARGDDPWISRNREALAAAQARVDEHLGSLELYGGVDGAEVSLDGEPAGRYPLPAALRWPVGRVTVRVRADGYAPLDRATVIHPGELTRESIAQRPQEPATPPPTQVLVPVLVAPAQPPAAPRRRPRPAPTWSDRVGVAPWVTLGAGVALAAVVAPLMVWRRDAAGDALIAQGCSLDATGAAFRCADPAAASQTHAQGDTFNTLANVAWIGGAAVAAAGVGWMIARALGDDRHATIGCAARGCALEVRF